MRNPYIIDEPAQIAFSGGRTSAYLLYQILEANGGLPAGSHVTFQNTGKEREETLEFVAEVGRRWGVPITWLEFTGLIPGKGAVNYKIVDFETAARDGEPFAELVRAKGYLPNPRTRICTAYLKIKTAGTWMRDLGYADWLTVMGIRADEPSRAARMGAPGRDNREGEPYLPMVAAGVSKRDVLAFWNAQPFDLALDPQGDMGNCDLCFLKARHKIVTALQAEPARGVWWEKLEQGKGAPFRIDRPAYKDLQREAEFYNRQHALPFEYPEDAAIVDCMCGGE